MIFSKVSNRTSSINSIQISLNCNKKFTIKIHENQLFSNEKQNFSIDKTETITNNPLKKHRNLYSLKKHRKNRLEVTHSSSLFSTIHVEICFALKHYITAKKGFSIIFFSFLSKSNESEQAVKLKNIKWKNCF